MNTKSVLIIYGEMSQRKCFLGGLHVMRFDVHAFQLQNQFILDQTSGQRLLSTFNDQGQRSKNLCPFSKTFLKKQFKRPTVLM